MKKIIRRQEGGIPWTNLMIDLVGAYILTAIILVVLAFLLFKFQLSQNVVGTGIIFTYMISCFLAGHLAGKHVKQKRYIWGLLMGVAYYLVLLVISVMVNQSFTTVTDSLFITIFLCAGGGMLGGMLS